MRKECAACRLLVICLCLVLCAGCSKQPEPEQDDSLSICATIFPIYALSERIARDVPDLQVDCLMQPQDGCIRSYELSEWDIAKIAAADAVIMGGRGLEAFESALLSEDAQLPSVSVLPGIELIGAEEEIDDETESHLLGANPWAFLSVERAKDMASAIETGLAGFDPDNEALYHANYESAVSALDGLLAEMMRTLSDVQLQPVALMHEGLIYMTEELGIETVTRIDREPGTAIYDNDWEEALDQLKAGGAQLVLLEKQAPDAMINTLEQAGYKVALIDTLTTYPIGAQFAHYISAMQVNALAIKDAMTAQ